MTNRILEEINRYVGQKLTFIGGDGVFVGGIVQGWAAGMCNQDKERSVAFSISFPAEVNHPQFGEIMPMQVEIPLQDDGDGLLLNSSKLVFGSKGMHVALAGKCVIQP